MVKFSVLTDPYDFFQGSASKCTVCKRTWRRVVRAEERMPVTVMSKEACLGRRKGKEEKRGEKVDLGDKLIRLPFLSLTQHQCKGSQPRCDIIRTNSGRKLGNDSKTGAGS